jgi:hypothetical protein
MFPQMERMSSIPPPRVEYVFLLNDHGNINMVLHFIDHQIEPLSRYGAKGIRFCDRLAFHND